MLCEIGIELRILVPRCEANGKVSNWRTKVLKLSQQTANGTFTDTAMRCPRTRKVRQRRVDQTKQNCIKKTASENESMTRSRRTNHQEPHLGGIISEVENLVNDVASQLKEKGNVSDKTIQMDNRITVSSKEFNEERLDFLAKRKHRNRIWKNSKTNEARLDQYKQELGKHSQLVGTRSKRSSMISRNSSARRVLYLKLKALKEQKELKVDCRNWSAQQYKKK